MNESRLDRFLEEWLQAGRPPEGMAPDERALLERLVAAQLDLKVTAAPAMNEASEVMPTARARFERFVAADQRTRAAVLPLAGGTRGRTWLGRLGLPRFAFAAVPAGILVLVVTAALVLGGGGADTALALTPGEYVQLGGVVANAPGSEGGDRSLVVASTFGEVRVAVPAETLAKGSAGEPEAGQELVIAGVVQRDGSVLASAVERSEGVSSRPRVAKLKELKDLRESFGGTVAMLTISPDGQSGRVVIKTARGEQYLVKLEAASVGELVDRFASALGTEVEVVGLGKAEGTYRLKLQPPGGPVSKPTAARGTTTEPSIVRVQGVIESREGLVMKVATGSATRTIRFTLATRFVLRNAGITLADVRDGQAVVGHTVTVLGAVDPRTGEVVADVVTVGPAAAGR